MRRRDPYALMRRGNREPLGVLEEERGAARLHRPIGDLRDLEVRVDLAPDAHELAPLGSRAPTNASEPSSTNAAQPVVRHDFVSRRSFGKSFEGLIDAGLRGASEAQSGSRPVQGCSSGGSHGAGTSAGCAYLGAMKPGDHPEFFRFPAPEGRSRESTHPARRRGRFFHDDALVEHPKLAAALHTWIARHPDDGRYILTNGYDWTYFTVDDVPFFVRSLRDRRSGDAILVLSDGDRGAARPGDAARRTSAASSI